jgi:CheY-like chemotaxis protein
MHHHQDYHMTQPRPSKSIILYADDDPDDLMLLTESFTSYSEDVEIITACDGFEALSYLKELPQDAPSPCLIILDINMPRRNGKETLIEIRQINRFAEIPVVMFTTSSLPHDKTFAERYKAGFITKPIDSRQMASIADTFIEHCTEEVRKTIRKK